MVIGEHRSMLRNNQAFLSNIGGGSYRLLLCFGRREPGPSNDSVKFFGFTDSHIDRLGVSKNDHSQSFV